MIKSLFVEDIQKEVINLLNPYPNFKSMIEFYHKSLKVEDKIFELKGNIHLFGVGKAASFEVNSFFQLLAENNLSNKVMQSVALTKEGFTVANRDIIQLEGTHPVISEKNIEITKEFISLLEKVGPEDSLIFLLSGGGSALLELPKDGMSFKSLQEKHKELLNSGENINEMNKERKKLSLVKNGALLNFIKTKNIIQFITCDIPNGRLIDVSSGPLLSDDNEEDYVLTIESQGAEKLLYALVNADQRRVKGKIYNCSLDKMIKDLLENLPEKKKILISGGEATFKVPNNSGLGGRNTHFVLAFARELYSKIENRDFHILSLGTDGADGPTDAAGAYLNYELFEKLDNQEYLKNFDSYNYFKDVGSLIKTGPTKTNVMDIRFIWRE